MSFLEPIPLERQHQQERHFDGNRRGRHRVDMSGISKPIKPMVCMRVTFQENDGNHENNGNDADNSDIYKQGDPGREPRVPQTKGLEMAEYQRCPTYQLHFPQKH